MFASFHSKRTISPCSDMLNTCANGVLICSTVSCSILGDIPSTPGDLFYFILLILLATTYRVKTNCPSLSPSGPLHFLSGTGNEPVPSLVNIELQCICNSSASTIPVLLYSQHCPPVANLISNILLTSYIRIETLTV